MKLGERRVGEDPGKEVGNEALARNEITRRTGAGDLQGCKRKTRQLEASNEPPCNLNCRKKGYMKIMKELWDETGYAYLNLTEEKPQGSGYQTGKSGWKPASSGPNTLSSQPWAPNNFLKFTEISGNSRKDAL